MSRVRSLILLSLILVPPRLAAQACGPGALSLQEGSVLALPGTGGIEGLATTPAGRLALWSHGSEVLELDRIHGLTRHPFPDSLRPAGLGITPAGYRLLDGLTGRDQLLGAGDSLATMGTVALAEGESLDRAVWRDGDWILLLRNLLTREFQLRRSGDPVPLYRSAPADSVKTIPRYHLSDGGAVVLLTRYTAPFDLIRLDPATGRTDTLAPLLAALPAIAAESLSHWRALPAVLLDCGLLVTLTDLTSDHRLLVRYGAGGTVDRVTPLQAPLGLMARQPGTTSVLAARRTGDLELVWYDWHWAREPGGSP